MKFITGGNFTCQSHWSLEVNQSVKLKLSGKSIDKYEYAECHNYINKSLISQTFYEESSSFRNCLLSCWVSKSWANTELRNLKH